MLTLLINQLEIVLEISFVHLWPRRNMNFETRLELSSIKLGAGIVRNVPLAVWELL